MWRAVLPFVVIILLRSSYEVDADCCNAAADIVFILDSSGSVGSVNFQKMKDFFKAVVDTFQVGFSCVRIGSVTFSSSVHDTFQLTEFFTKSGLKNRISSIPFNSGDTDTAAGSRYARTTSFSSLYSRSNVTKIAIVVTAGQSNSRSATLSEAQLLRNNSVVIFSFGVGNGINMTELEEMASKQSFAVYLSSFNALFSMWDRFSKPTYEVTSCGHPGTPINGYLHGNDFCSGKTVTYDCKNGYKLMGDNRRTCLTNKTWSGRLPTCIFFNTCRSNPCQNGATCINGENMYTCDCVSGYSGVHCERESVEIHKQYMQVIVGHNDIEAKNDDGKVEVIPLSYSLVVRLSSMSIVGKSSIYETAVADSVVYFISSLQGYMEPTYENIQPPMVQNCPSDIRKTASVRVDIFWKAPHFYDPFNHSVEVSTNYPDHGSTFLWGDYVAWYSAFKSSNGLRAECTFKIVVRSIPCTNVTIPNNGALVCNGWKRESIQFCVVFCQMGTRLSLGHDFRTRYICGGSGQWLPTGNFPSCEVSQVSPRIDRPYYFKVCDTNNKHRMKKGYLWILRYSNFGFLCNNYRDLCKMENVEVQC